MSIWGKIVGGTAGLVLGGPLGAVLGGLAGHVYDRLKDAGEREAARLGDAAHRAGPYGADADQDPRQAAFATAVIVLSAKMAKADGQVTRNEVDAFKRAFNIPPDDMAAVGAIYDRAKRTSDGYAPYARQMASLFADDPPMLENVLQALYMIALADGVLHPREVAFMRGVAGIFGFADYEFDRIHHGNTRPEEVDPYRVLGLSRDMDDEALRTAYRKLLRANHPDVMTAKGLPREMIELANDKMARINAAWDRIRAERGLK